MKMHEGGLKRLNLHGNGVAKAQWITLVSRIMVERNKKVHWPPSLWSTLWINMGS